MVMKESNVIAKSAEIIETELRRIVFVAMINLWDTVTTMAYLEMNKKASDFSPFYWLLWPDLFFWVKFIWVPILYHIVSSKLSEKNSDIFFYCMVGLYIFWILVNVYNILVF